MNDISSVLNITSGSIQIILHNNMSANKLANDDSETFDGLFNAAVNMISGTNNYLQEAQKAEVAFATGELTSPHELAVIEQKANLSLQYTVAVKNQLLSAYKEIMNMQI